MTAKTSGEFVIMAVGDVHVDRSDPSSIFTYVAPLLRAADTTGETTGQYRSGRFPLGRPQQIIDTVNNIKRLSYIDDLARLLAMPAENRIMLTA